MRQRGGHDIRRLARARSITAWPTGGRCDTTQTGRKKTLQLLYALRERMNPRFLVLLGAGASIEAGLPSALAVTQLLIRLSDDPTSARIRRIGQVVTVLREQAARLSGVSVDEVDFEHIFGALVEAVERRDP